MHVFILLSLLLFPFNAFAQDLPVPRFVSLSTDEVNVRAGPGRKYPVLWVYERKFLPVEVIREHGNWRRIRDYDGNVGWVFHTLLSGRRSALIDSADPVALLKKPEKSVADAFFEPLVMVHLSRCNDSYCLVEKDIYSGWIERKLLWGVYEHENID